MANSDLTKYLSPRQALNILWDRGVYGTDLLKEHSAFMDRFISTSYERVDDCLKKQTALIALGGYGRQEHFPFSDVDLMVLYHPDTKDRISEVSEAVFYPLWDAGLDVGHGVRSISECLDDASEDFFFQVAMLDARLICGNRDLFYELIDRFKKEFVEGRRREFVYQMIAHREERHRRFGDHAYLLEPNIKEGRGGFRDIQSVLWTSKTMFGISSMHGLVEEGLILKNEGERVEQAYNSLIRIRNSLHYTSGRKNDRLYFEYQEDIARKLRHYDSNSMLGVESFMGHVYTCMESIAVVSDLFFDHVNDTLTGNLNERRITLEAGIELVADKIHASPEETYINKPFMLMRIFEVASQYNATLHYRTKRAVTANASLATADSFRNSKKVASSFLKSIKNPSSSKYLLETMLETTLLQSYLPEFEHLIALVQHDVYHTLTVDRHLVQTVHEIHNLSNEHAALFEGSDIQTLLLAGLFHDIGKGLGGKHEARGAELAGQISKRLGLSHNEIETLQFLIRNHLFLINIAVRRDLEDESLIIKCARRIKDPCRLKMLVLLTIADSMATGPGVWNEWKAALLLELYHKIAHLLEQPELIDPEREQAVEWMREQVAERLKDEDLTVAEDLPEDYLLSFTPDAVSHHLNLRRELLEKRKGVILKAEDRGNHWSILLLAKDKTGLLARIFGILSLHNMSVLNAQIFTLPGGVAIDTIDVKGTIDNDFKQVDWLQIEEQLIKAINRRLAVSYRLDEKFRGLCKSATAASRPAKAVIENESSDFFTIIEVFSDESQATLYKITLTLADFGINIFKAKIASKADQSVEVFYVLDDQGEKIDDKEFVDEIKNALIYAAETAYCS